MKTLVIEFIESPDWFGLRVVFAVARIRHVHPSPSLFGGAANIEAHLQDARLAVDLRSNASGFGRACGGGH
jgi:hypothetical protein